jgi:hypothetical protein
MPGSGIDRGGVRGILRIRYRGGNTGTMGSLRANQTSP